MPTPQTLELPEGLETYGSAEWWSVRGTQELCTILQLEHALTDDVVTVFDAWKDDHGVDPRKLSYAVDSIDRRIIKPTVTDYDEHNPSQDFSLRSNGDYYRTPPFSLGPIVMVENDRSPLWHAITLHIRSDKRGMTPDIAFNDERIRVEGASDLYPDRRWVSRAIGCAGLIAANVSTYIKAAKTNEEFLAEFFAEKIQVVQEVIDEHRLNVSKTDGRVEENFGRKSVVPYRGIAIRRASLTLAEVRIPTNSGDSLPLGQKVYIAPNIARALRDVDAQQQLINPLEELLNLGGLTGPVNTLVSS